MSNLIQSVSAPIRPNDSRCKYWAKTIRFDEALPLPSNIEGASDLPGAYLKQGEEELMPGDFLIEGEANHHRRTDRGWSYTLSYMNAEGDLETVTPTAEHKATMKANGMDPTLLKGSGDIAACVRLAMGLRHGIDAGIPALASGPVDISQTAELGQEQGHDLVDVDLTASNDWTTGCDPTQPDQVSTSNDLSAGM